MLVISIVVKGGESRGGFGSGLRFLCVCRGTGMASGPSGIMAGEGVLSFRAVLWCPVVKDWKVGRWQASFHSPCGCSHRCLTKRLGLLSASVGSATGTSGLPGEVQLCLWRVDGPSKSSVFLHLTVGKCLFSFSLLEKSPDCY